jgi:hypothetical protein
MRCRKVRSYLSAYSNGELSGRDLVAVREHISTCAGCRREEALFSSIRETVPVLKSAPLSADFNTKLLNRIAHERFAETRTRAYLPHSAPAIPWFRVIPVVASVLVVALVAVGLLRSERFGQPGAPQAVAEVSTNSAGQAILDDGYLTAQPFRNPNMATSVQRDWSLNTRLAQAERASRISGQLTRTGGFAGMNPAGGLEWNGIIVMGRSPYGGVVIQVNPILRTYQQPGNNTITEARQIY